MTMYYGEAQATAPMGYDGGQYWDGYSQQGMAYDSQYGYTNGYDQMAWQGYGGATAQYQTNRSGDAFNCLCKLRYIGHEVGFAAANQRVQQEGPILTGYSVYCAPAQDRNDLRALVDAAGGRWLEHPPDEGMAQAMSILSLSEFDGIPSYPAQTQTAPMTPWGNVGTLMTDFGPQDTMIAAPPSEDAYLESRLRPCDFQVYMAAGLQFYRRRKCVIEWLLPREEAWNNQADVYEPLAWNILGVRRARGWEHDPQETAVRCLVEVFGGISGAPSARTLRGKCARSVAVWYPRGKYALFLHEIEEHEANIFMDPDLSERYKERRSQPATKYPKKIEGFEWVQAADFFASDARHTLTDLLEKFSLIDAVRKFITTGDLPPGVAPPKLESTEGKGGKKGDRDEGKGGKKGDRDGCKGGAGKGKRGQEERKGWAAKGESASSWGIDGGAVKGKETAKAKEKAWEKGGDRGKGTGWEGWETQYGYSKGKWNGGQAEAIYKGDQAKGDAWATGGKNGGMAKGKNGGKETGGQLPARQLLGEKLFVLVKGLAPSYGHTIVQKITGMLLDLPHDEITSLLEPSAKGKLELEERVAEARQILEEEGALA